MHFRLIELIERQDHQARLVGHVSYTILVGAILQTLGYDIY